MGPEVRRDHLPLQIGGRVRALRDAQGLSGRKLAATAGVSQPFLSQLESGQTSVAIATLYRIASALGVGPSDLLPPPTQPGIEILRAPEIRHMAISDEADAAVATRLSMVGRSVVISGWVTVAAGFASMAVHNFAGTDGDPEGWSCDQT